MTESDERLDSLATTLVRERYGEGDAMGMQKLWAGAMMELRQVTAGLTGEDAERALVAFAERYRSRPR